MRFWDEAIWTSIYQFGILMSVLLFANMLRRKVSIIRKSLLPSAVIGGLIILILKFIPAFEAMIDKPFLEMITYHTLGLGFISIALKVKEQHNSNKAAFVDTGAVIVSTYVMQGVVGLAITFLLSITFMPALFAASGFLLPLGFGQGPGQALNFGTVYQELGFTGGPDFGLTIAGVGFLVACIVGVSYMNILKRKHKVVRAAEPSADDPYTAQLEVASPNEIPLTESVDKFTIQIAIVIFTYFLTYLLLRGLTILVTPMGDFATNTLIPLLWGFNFLFGTLIAVLIGLVMKFLKKLNIMRRQYPNNFMLNRIGGLMFDLMVIASIAAIDFTNLKTLFIPLALIAIIGTIATIAYLRFICKRVFPDYEFQAFFSLFGNLTGTASTGMILLREVDDKFETPAATNLVLGSLPAILLGFPLLLLLGVAPLGTVQLMISVAILITMFLIYNVFLLRRQIFKRKQQS